MNENNQTRKRIILSLTALLIGSLLYIFGISITVSQLPTLLYYIIALFLYISAFLSVFQQYKKEKNMIYIFIIILSLFLIIFTTYVTIIQLS